MNKQTNKWGQEKKKVCCTYVTRHNKTGQLSVTKKNVTFLLSERAFNYLKDDTTHV